MVSIQIREDSQKVLIVGHGLSVSQRTDLAPGIAVTPEVPKINLDFAAEGSERFSDYAAAIQGSDIASFAIEIIEVAGGNELVMRAWNSLWTFYLLSLACRAPCFPLYAVTDGEKPAYTATNRNIFIRALPSIAILTTTEVEWARKHADAFDDMIAVPEFASAIRCYGNAHYLPDFDVRIMLLWSGIEGLLSVDGELNRRLALYAAIIYDGSASEKQAYFDQVKKAYGVRSRAVHGGRASPKQLKDGYELASRILMDLLRKCVEIGRVPKPTELDNLAVTPTIR